MEIKHEVLTSKIGSDEICFSLLPSGDIHLINYQDKRISMYPATTLDGMIANLYLRITKEHEIFYTRLIGINSPSSFQMANNQVNYQGVFKNVAYLVNLKIIDTTWFWTVDLTSNDHLVQAELFYGQDLSLNCSWANEAYVCQYLDHKVVKATNGYHIISKQNQDFPFMIRQGTLSENNNFATDGFDFFGKDYKFTNHPAVMLNGDLPSTIYQYEFAYISFQTPKVKLDKPYQAIFYADFIANYHELANFEISLDQLRTKYQSVVNHDINGSLSKINLNVSFQDTYPFVPFTSNELANLFFDKELIEEEDGKILSWFNQDGTHYVTGDKEYLLERPCGNIIINNSMNKLDKLIMTSTNWIYGIFNSHIAYGNTNFNKMISISRTPLNLLKVSGQRLFVKIDGKYQLLTMPAVYKMTFNSSTWYYKIKDDILQIDVAIDKEEGLINTTINSLNEIKYDYLMTLELVMGSDNYHHPITTNIIDNIVYFNFDKSTMAYEKYPNLSFSSLIAAESFSYFNDAFFFNDNISRNNPIFGIKINNSSSFSHYLYGFIEPTKTFKQKSITKLKNDYFALHEENINHFHLAIDEDNENAHEIKKLNLLTKWFTHNALIHYASPHGLEQYGGAGWGTRDVCQGPVELFSSFKRYDLVRNIILMVYRRQFEENGDWPQWFMFDRYRHIQADSSHGDIIIWPLLIVAKYIQATDDKEILKVKIPYTKANGDLTIEATLLEHIKKQIKTIESNFVENTFLSSYGGGDWDDTLQPSNRHLTKRLVSGWTVALTIEAIEAINEVLEDEDNYQVLVNKIKDDYHRYLIHDSIPAGFIYLDQEIKYLLHPNDDTTGIKYRLLPFNRGMISELFAKRNIKKYLKLIDEHLMHPDGVRLMNTTVKYRGGNPQIFIRAETATNFGREIGLQYVHAHIRYLEAMAKIGEGTRLFHGLKVINPILIKENVVNALTRQSNTYFTSSDGVFNNRYEADANFEKLRTGNVLVKGGWRLYSSGPGIYLNQLISQFLGIKQYQNNLYLDPVLPKSLNGLKCFYDFEGYHLNITYEVTSESGVKAVIINGRTIKLNTAFNKYRRSGVIVFRSYLEKENEIIVKM